VVPFLRMICRVSAPGHRPAGVIAYAVNADNQHFRNRLLAGRFFRRGERRAVVVSEYLLYRWGITGDEAVGAAVGQTLRLEYRPGRQPPAYLLDLLRSSRLDLTPAQRKTLEKAAQNL